MRLRRGGRRFLLSEGEWGDGIRKEADGEGDERFHALMLSPSSVD